MSNWWSGLSTRERYVVAGGGYVAIIALAIVLFVEPAYKDSAAARARLQREEQISARLATIASEAQTLRAGNSASRDRAPGESLFALLDATATAAGVAKSIARITPRAEDEVAVTFESVPFDQLASWLATLAIDHGVEVSEATINHSGDAGRVSASLTLTE